MIWHWSVEGGLTYISRSRNGSGPVPTWTTGRGSGDRLEQSRDGFRPAEGSKPDGSSALTENRCRSNSLGRSDGRMCPTHRSPAGDPAGRRRVDCAQTGRRPAGAHPAARCPGRQRIGVRHCLDAVDPGHLHGAGQLQLADRRSRTDAAGPGSRHPGSGRPGRRVGPVGCGTVRPRVDRSDGRPGCPGRRRSAVDGHPDPRCCPDS